MKTLLTNSKTLIASALAMGVALSPMAVNAEATDSVTAEQQKSKKGSHKKGQKEFRKMAKYLALSEAQITEIKAIRESMKAENEAQSTELKGFKEEVKALVASNNFTDDNFIALYDKYELAIEQKSLNKAKMQNAIYQILTPEQKVKWENFKGKEGKKGKKGKNKDAE